LEERRNCEKVLLMKSSAQPESLCLPVVTPDGTFLAHYSANGLAELDFPERGRIAEPNRSSVPDRVQQWHRLTERALTAILSGKAPEELPPFDVSSGSDFQRRVWRALCEIPFGQTRSYMEVAKAMGDTGAVRAVGGACGANRIPVLIPCHRVLAAGNKIGGFSAGLDWKRRLLEREGVLQKPLL
jgi:O-6-methylguanine DNA methyltransferase